MLEDLAGSQHIPHYDRMVRARATAFIAAQNGTGITGPTRTIDIDDAKQDDTKSARIPRTIMEPTMLLFLVLAMSPMTLTVCQRMLPPALLLPLLARLLRPLLQALVRARSGRLIGVQICGGRNDSLGLANQRFGPLLLFCATLPHEARAFTFEISTEHV